MKNKILIVCFCLLNFKAFSQFKLGITTGGQFAHTRSNNANNESRFALNAGFTSLVNLSENIQLNSMLIFTGKGYKYYNTFGQLCLVKPLYLELPVVVRFDFKTSENVSVFLGVGAYYAMGIGGKETYYENGSKQHQKILYGSSSNDILTRSDAGLVFQFGGTFHDNFEGFIYYDMGLLNIIPDATTNTFNRVIGFNLAWYLPLKNKKG